MQGPVNEPVRAPEGRTRRWAVRLLVAPVGVVLALLVLEGAARVFFPEWAPTRADRNFWVHDETLGWAHRPGESGRMVHAEFAIDVSINSMGLRDREYGPEPAPGKRRMIVLGDSFGWGFGVQHEEIFCELIEAQRDDLEVVNASVSGYGTDQQVLWFERTGAKLNPDLVLLLFFENDFENNARSFQYYHHKPRFDLTAAGGLELVGVPVPAPTRAERVHAYILGNTYLLARLYIVLGAGLLERGVADAERARAENRFDRSTEVTRLLFARLAERARAIGAELIVTSVPTHPAYSVGLQGMLEPMGVRYVPLDQAFAAADGPTTFENDGHWNARGHALAADALVAMLGDELR